MNVASLEERKAMRAIDRIVREELWAARAFAEHAAAEISAAAAGMKAHAEAAVGAGDFDIAIIPAVEWRRINAVAVERAAVEKFVAREGRC